MGTRRDARDRGAAMILVLMATALLAALASGLIVLTTTERRTAANEVSSVATLCGAEAAMERTIGELRRIANWTDVLGGVRGSEFVDSTKRPSIPSPGRVDLDALTIELQAESNAPSIWGANTPVWRLFSSGPLARLAGIDADQTNVYTATWVADDGSDNDGNARADSNQIIVIHAEAYGPANARRVVDVTVAQTPSGVQILAWR